MISVLFVVLVLKLGKACPVAFDALRNRLPQPLLRVLQRLDKRAQPIGERLSGPHEFGWFIVNGLIKLGLLGTVIGFIVMLATVDSATSFDVAAVQQLLVGMSQGMRVALYTTLAGLATSMVLSLHYLLLDRAADRLQARIVTFAQQRHLG